MLAANVPTSLLEHFSQHVVLLIHPHKLFANDLAEPLSARRQTAKAVDQSSLSQCLPNKVNSSCPELYPNGDVVQTVKPWDPPNAWADLGNATLNQILDKIDAGMGNGERYNHTAAATGRAAWKVVVEVAPNKAEGQAREIIKAWIKSGVLEEYEYRSEADRKDRKGLRVNDAQRPGTTTN
jgi:hypothetical protein